MPQLLRACALGLAMLIAHLGHLLSHPAAPAQPALPPLTPAADDLTAAERTEQVELRIELRNAKRPAPHPVVLPGTGTAAPAPRPVHYSGTIAQIIQQAFAPLGSSAVTWAERVAMCESGDNPNAVNRSSGAEGLFQIMPGTWAGTPYASASEFDPVANAKAAAYIYAHRGPSAWTCT